MEHKTVDARGRSCPEPVVLTKQALDKLTKGRITVLVDAEVARENVSRYARNLGCSVEIKNRGASEYEILITKE